MNRDSKIGNTKSIESQLLPRNSKNKQGNQYPKWTFTYNNIDLETKIEIEQILKKNCSKYIFEKEIGSKSHIEHLQGQCRFNTRKRLTEIKKIFKNHNPHWEPTNSEKHSVDYCTKDAISIEDVHHKGYYNEKMLFFDLLSDAKLRFNYFETFYEECIDELIEQNKHCCTEIDQVSLVRNEQPWETLYFCYANAIIKMLNNIKEYDIYTDYHQHLIYKEQLELKVKNSLK